MVIRPGEDDDDDDDDADDDDDDDDDDDVAGGCLDVFAGTPTCGLDKKAICLFKG